MRRGLHKQNRGSGRCDRSPGDPQQEVNRDVSWQSDGTLQNERYVQMSFLVPIDPLVRYNMTNRSVSLAAQVPLDRPDSETQPVRGSASFPSHPPPNYPPFAFLFEEHQTGAGAVAVDGSARSTYLLDPNGAWCYNKRYVFHQLFTQSH